MQIRLFILAAITFLLCSCDNSSQVTIYTANKIITMNVAHPNATAVAVLNDKIFSVGTLQEVIEKSQAHTQVIDHRFADKTILPGFIEPHLHPAIAGLLLPMEFITPHDWNLPGKSVTGVKTPAGYLKRLTQYESSLDQDDWLWSWGYHNLFHGELSRQMLDEISTTRPIIVWHRSFHEIFVNTSAIEALDIEESDNPQADFAKGHFFENGLFDITDKITPILTSPLRYLGALKHAAKIIHAGGVTTVSDGAFGGVDFNKEYTAIKFSSWNRSSTPFRFNILLDAKNMATHQSHEQTFAQIETLNANSSSEYNTDRITILPKQVKLFADGAAYSQLMQMSEGYLDGHHGEWLMTPEKLEQAVRIYWHAGYQIHLHVNGDLGLDATLDIVEKMQQELPRQDHRLTVHHFAYARPEQAQRMAELGVLVQANPYYVWALANIYSEFGLGPERAANMVPLKSVVDANIPLAFHSDFTMAPVQPLLLAWAAVTRQTAEGNVMGPQHKISVQQALEAITINAAFQMQLEKDIGSIEVGKSADFTILEQDPFSIPKEKIKDIKIWGTIFEGNTFKNEKYEESFLDI
jgi:predicted amidohydrolase YtcJ